MAENESQRNALFVLPADWTGGAENVLTAAARHLADMPGWSVEIAVIAAKSTGFVEARKGRARVTYGKGVGRLGAEWRLVSRLRQRHFALVFSSHLRVNAFLSVMRRSGRMRCDRLVTRESTVLADRSGGLRWKAYQVLYHLYGAQDMIIAQTHYMADRIRTFVPRNTRQRVEVVPNPVDISAIRVATKEALPAELSARLRAVPHIAWCGRLIDVKRPLLALEVLSILRNHHKYDVGMIIIGNGPLRGAVQEKIRALGLSERAVATGHLANPFPIFAACQAGLLTSRAEGFPNVLLEMMACGIQQIVTTPCAGDLNELKGVKISGNDATELARDLAMRSNSTGDFEAVLSKRSVAAFLERVL